MTAEDAQRMIELLELIETTGQQLVLYAKVIAIAACLRLGQAFMDRVLWSKNTKKLW